MNPEPHPSFSRGRKFSLSLNLCITLLALLALLLMVNYLAGRHFRRWSWSAHTQTELSPLSQRVLSGVTNSVRVTLYFRKDDPLFEMCWSLLKVYRFANDRVELEAVDYDTEPGAAEVVKARYKLKQADKDMVIFDCQGRQKVIYQGELSDLDLQPLISGQSREIRRTHFKGEALFTSAILTVMSPRTAKAYFLEGHGEHNPESDDGQLGYSQFASVLHQNNVQFEKVNLAGPAEVPADCNLLIVAGPRAALQPEVLEKVDRYLQNGGRMFVLFFSFAAAPRATGLEQALAGWGVVVGGNVVRDEKNFVSPSMGDLVTATFGPHPLVKPLYLYQLYLVLPRSVDRDPASAKAAGALQVDPLVYTSPSGRVITDVRTGGVINPGEGDVRGNVPLMVAVERGGIHNVSAERGATRLVVVGDSLFLSNNNIDREANREFASHAINWLLARNELLVGVPPKRLIEYKLTMTAAQMTGARWLLMGAFPGAALALGTLVWLRRRR